MRGYTLIELIVAVGLFAFVMTIAGGAYLVMIGTNRRAEAEAESMDSLSFALETMARSIRTGTGFNCGGPNDCPPETSFSFTNADGCSVTYEQANASVCGAGYTSDCIVRKKNCGAGSVQVPLTDPSISISRLSFTVSGTKPEKDGDTNQPFAIISVGGSSDAGHGVLVPFTTETSAVMRGADL